MLSSNLMAQKLCVTQRYTTGAVSCEVKRPCKVDSVMYSNPDTLFSILDEQNNEMFHFYINSYYTEIYGELFLKINAGENYLISTYADPQNPLYYNSLDKLEARFDTIFDGSNSYLTRDTYSGLFNVSVMHRVTGDFFVYSITEIEEVGNEITFELKEYYDFAREVCEVPEPTYSNSDSLFYDVTDRLIKENTKGIVEYWNSEIRYNFSGDLMRSYLEVDYEGDTASVGVYTYNQDNRLKTRVINEYGFEKIDSIEYNEGGQIVRQKFVQLNNVGSITQEETTLNFFDGQEWMGAEYYTHWGIKGKNIVLENLGDNKYRFLHYDYPRWDITTIQTPPSDSAIFEVVFEEGFLTNFDKLNETSSVKNFDFNDNMVFERIEIKDNQDRIIGKYSYDYDSLENPTLLSGDSIVWATEEGRDVAYWYKYNVPYNQYFLYSIEYSSCGDFILSITEDENQLKTELYPNPTNGIVILKKHSNYEVFDSYGKLIFKDKGDELDLTTLDTGVYFIKLPDQVHRIVKL